MLVPDADFGFVDILFLDNKLTQVILNSLPIHLMFRFTHSIIFFGILFFVSSTASAQQGSQWTDPVRLSVQGAFPTLAVDHAGQVHAVWTENKTGLEIAGWGDTLFYSAYSNGEWSMAVDIIAAPQSFSADFPSLIVDYNNFLHLFWRTGSRIFHSFVNPTEANSALNWSRPVPVVYFDFPAVASNVPYAVAIDENNRFHISYLQSDGTTWSLEYIYSDDSGISWSSPQIISIASDGIAYILPRIAVAPEGQTIHIVWTNAILPDGFPYTGVFYLHSTDGGTTWSQPLQLGGAAQGFANMVATTSNTVHVVWNGSAEGQGRYHRWSPDAGATWYDVTRISESGGLTQGWPALALDSADTLHFFMFAGSDAINDDLYYMYWQLTQGWSQEELISVEPTGNYTGQPAATVSYGNQLHTIWVVFEPRNNALPGLWHRAKVTMSPSTTYPPFLLPSPVVNPSPTTSDISDSLISTDNELPFAQPDFSRTPSPVNNTIQLLLPLVVSMVFIGLVVILLRLRKQ